MLRGKTALITGGGTGIGRAIALTLVREGVNVASDLKRIATPEDIAEVAYGLIDKASFVTGQVIVVDGGNFI